MANSIFNSPHNPGVTDRQLSGSPSTPQPVAVANTGRTYAYIEKLGRNDEMWVSIGTPRGQGPGAIRLSNEPGGTRAIDSSAIPELTQAAIFICGDTPFAEFTFMEVAATQSAQS